MKRMLAILLMLTLAVSLHAQDGIYGSFTLGQKIVDLSPLNDRLQASAPGGLGLDVEFHNNYWLLGGEGHIILAKHFVIGGKGMAMWNEEKPKGTSDQTIKIVGGLGVGSVGYAFLAGEDKQVRLIPQVGVGVSSFLIQNKFNFQGDQSQFNNAFVDDRRSALTKAGLAIDFCLMFDWYISVIELLKIIPGLNFGPLIHADAGYTIVPGNTEWVRDFNDPGNDLKPDLSFAGFYFNVGIGIGLSSSRQEKKK